MGNKNSRENLDFNPVIPPNSNNNSARSKVENPSSLRDNIQRNSANEDFSLIVESSRHQVESTNLIIDTNESLNPSPRSPPLVSPLSLGGLNPSPPVASQPSFSSPRLKLSGFDTRLTESQNMRNALEVNKEKCSQVTEYLFIGGQEVYLIHFYTYYYLFTYLLVILFGGKKNQGGKIFGDSEF